MHTLLVAQNLLDPLCTQLRGLLRSRLDSQGPETASFETFESSGVTTLGDVAVVVLDANAERGLEVLGRLRHGMSRHVLAVGQIADSKIILRALQSGADYFLDEADLEASFDAGLARLKLKQERQAPAGRLLAVVSASGGTGASTLAANIATVLAGDEQKCALIDLKPGRGDLASLLDLKPQFTLADLCLNVTRLDRAMFEKMLVRHQSGVHLLGSPQMFGDVRVVTAQGVSQALQLARTHFPCVVVDVEDCFHEEQVVVLRQATGIILVARLDFTSLRNARRILEHLQDVDVPRNLVRIVISRYGQANELPVDEAEEALGEKLNHFIPDDPRTVNGANNAGIPVVLRAPKQKVAQAIVQLARAALDRRREPAVLAGTGR
jgi:pilus assembly protein CpaE